MKLCLIADESPVVRRVVTHLMEQYGFLSIEAASARQALTIFQQEQPQLVFVDWQLKDVSAFDTIRAMREIQPGNAAMIVFLTTESDPAVWAKAAASGADLQLLKPFTSLELRETLAFEMPAA
jgi:two-component system chemotaxis response regulator CheY